MMFVATVALPSGYLSKVSAAVQKASRRVGGSGGSAPAKAPAAKQPARKSKPATQPQQGPNEYVEGVRLPGEKGIERTTFEIMQTQATAVASSRHLVKPEREIEGREDRPQNPDAKAVASWPIPDAASKQATPVTPNIHTTSSSFDGATLTDTGAFPPDSMGTVGPTQFITFVNGRLRSFTKAGVADGVINADPDVFFASVMTPVSPPVLLNFTSDPQVRYDRFSGRWFLTIIDVPCTNATCTTTAPNRLLLAVSDAASMGTISGSTVWTFFQFQGDPGTNFLDYPSLGIDVNALYIGGNMFTSAGSFVGTNGYVVQKASVLGAGPLVVTLFANLAAGVGAGPLSPRGVDNFDSGATEGYIVGVDNAAFSLIQFRRITNPGSLTPTISGNISVTVPTTTFPNRVEHAGNTGGLNGGLDSLDDRMYAAMIRNGRLWSAHNFRVSSAGVANTAAASRNASRWYEFQNLTTTPTLVQAGTVFDNAATRAAARQYFIPSVTVTGQGHAVLGFTMAGVVGATPAYVGRLAGDTLGTMVGPPTTAATTFGTTTANYNPPADPGGAAGRRWGDYSFTSVDPLDDMTIWTIQEYNQASNSYAVRVAKLAAPPPATPSSSAPPTIAAGQASVSVTITGTSSGGSGFYDPGTNLPPPALPFTHISASVTGGVTVNSVTYNTPTSITLNLNTIGASAGLQNVTVTNPDGQSATGNNLITITGPACTLTCPTNVVVSNDAGQCSALVNYSAPTTSGTCGAVTCSPSSGSIFPVGTTTVNCSEPGGATCSFTVTVNYTQVPTVTPGGPTTFCAGGSVTLTSSSATGNQWNLNGNPIGGATNQTYIATASGSYTVTVTVGACSSTSVATVVTVNPTPPTPTITPGGPTTFCAGGSVTLTSSSATGNQWFLNGNPIGGATNQTYAATASGNYTVVVTINGCSSAPSAATTVTVNPIPPTPTITPGGPTTFCAGGSVTLTSSSATGNQWYLNGNPIGGETNQSYVATASGSYTVVVTVSGCPSAPSAATVVTVNPTPPTPTITPGGPTTFCPGGSVTLTSSSASGNQWNLNGNPIAGAINQTFNATASGSYTVTVTANGCSSAPSSPVTVNASDTTPPTVTCPANITASTSPNQCTAVVTYTTPSGNDNCTLPANAVVCSPPSGGSFPKGTTTVTCTVTDAASLTGTCTFTVTVNDTQNPTITCPANQTVNTVSAPAVVNYPVPTVSDNCSGVGTPVCSPASGSMFPVGTTTVNCSVSDASNNTASCSFTVTVVVCTITCPTNIVRANDPNQCGAVTTFAPSATAGCGTVACSPASGSFFPKGTTTVTCSTTAGPSCSFTVTVNDTQPPVITCPANQTAIITNSTASCAVANYTTVASDNCPGVAVVCSPASGSCFPLGVTTVTCTATDGSGNTATCSFTVSVFDVCIQDDSNAGTVILINSATGAYRFCCNGSVFTGTGKVKKKGSVVTLEHNTETRRVYGKVDRSTFTGTGWIQQPPGTTLCTITDRDIRDNSCICQ